MASATIPVDLFNPGQVFACLGFMEAADVLLGGSAGETTGAFDWSPPATTFTLAAPGAENPVEAVLAFLAGADVFWEVPTEPVYSPESWVVERRGRNDRSFPYKPPEKPASLPAILVNARDTLRISSWADTTNRDNIKFWAGMQGMPGAEVIRRTLELIKHASAVNAENPLGFNAPQQSSLRFDWRRDYIPIEVGFSPNLHKTSITMVGYPVVEIMAAIGLENARPERQNKLAYRYHVTKGPLPLPLARAALGARLAPPEDESSPLAQRTFRMELGWPGQEGQARCITNVLEETST